MKYLFVAQIFNVEISSVLKKGKSIRPGARITNCLDEIVKILDYSIFKKNIGYFSNQEFTSWNGIHYIATGKFENKIDNIDLIGNSFCGALLREIQHFLHELWKVKDHGGYVRDGFLVIYDKNYDDGVLYRASLSEVYMKANLSIETTMFNIEELDNSIKAWQGYDIPDLDELNNDQSGIKWKYPTHISFHKDTENKPVQRFYYNTAFARASSITPMKILFYCAALESLFSFEKSPEIAYRISERVAICIGNDLTEKRAIFELVRKAYDVRSKVIHGNFFRDSELDNQIILSSHLDDLLRKVTKFVDSSEIDFNNIDYCKKYFLNKALE